MLETKVETKANIKNFLKLDKSYINYTELISKQLPSKFNYLDDWLLKKSNLLIKEVKSPIKSYKVYKRGTIVKVDFGVNPGSEMSQIHFAIVINNNDNPRNNVVTVIPLTSKENKYNLNLDKLIIEKMIDKLNQEMTRLSIESETTGIRNSASIHKLANLVSYYSSYMKHSYACINLITTVSKTRILPPINEFDIIGREKCSNEVLDKIDFEIMKKFTNNKNLTNNDK